MSLPKKLSPEFSTTLPSDGTKIYYRPFRVKEEKTLLIAAESKDPDMIVDTTLNLLQSCILRPDLDIRKLPFFDIEFMFLKIRAKSVGEIMKMAYRHINGLNKNGVECNHVTEIDVNIDDIEIVKDEEHSRDIDIGEYKVRFRYPTLNDILKLNSGNSDIETINVMASCLESVYDSTEVHVPDNLNESIEFIDNLSDISLKTMLNFFKTMPTIKKTISYHCPACNEKDTITLKGINDFF